MNVFVNPEICIGCGLCCEICDSVFHINDDGKSEAYKKSSEQTQNDVQQAIDSCPVSAISWVE